MLRNSANHERALRADAEGMALMDSSVDARVQPNAVFG